jgi:hypothetical protein
MQDWKALLAQGPGEPPGREQAVREAKERTQARLESAGGVKRARGSNKRAVTKVSRSKLRKGNT